MVTSFSIRGPSAAWVAGSRPVQGGGDADEQREDAQDGEAGQGAAGVLAHGDLQRVYTQPTAMFFITASRVWSCAPWHISVVARGRLAVRVATVKPSILNAADVPLKLISN